jgi:hypothetical protein
MPQNIGCQKTMRLSELGSLIKEMVIELGQANTIAESRLLFIDQEHPIAILQDYDSYRRLLHRLESSERALQIAEARERLRQLNEGLMTSIPFNEISLQNISPVGEYADVSN